MTTTPPSALAPVAPHITITNMGPAIEINGKFYRITSLHIKKPNSNQWQALDLDGLDAKHLEKLHQLTARIQRIASALGDEFDPGDAKKISFIANRTHIEPSTFHIDHPKAYGFLSKIPLVKRLVAPREPLSFEFHEIAFKEDGAEEFTRIKLDAELYDPRTQARLRHGAKEGGEAARDLADGLPALFKGRKRNKPASGTVTPQTAKRRKTATSSHQIQRTPTPGNGNCLPLSIIHWLRKLPTERQEALQNKGIDLNDGNLHQVLRTKAIDYIANQAKFLDPAHLQSMLTDIPADELAKIGLSTNADLSTLSQAQKENLRDTYTGYFKLPNRALGQPALQALADILEVPIVVFENTRAPGQDQIRSTFLPEVAHQGLETEHLITVYYAGHNNHGHYEYADPGQAAILGLIEADRLQCIQRLQAAYSGAPDPTTKINHLMAPISDLRARFPRLLTELADEIGATPNTMDDGEVAQMLLLKTDFAPIRTRLEQPKPVLTVEEPD